MIKRFWLQMLGFNILMAEGDEPGGGGTPKFSGQYKEMLDPVSKTKVMVPVELETFFGHTISQTRNAVKDEYEGKYKPLLETLEKEAGEGSQAKAELEKLRLDAMSAEDRAQANAKKVIEEHEKARKIAVEESSSWKQRFEKSTIKNDIMSSFGDAKLCNASQVAMLFEMEGQAKISEVVDEDGKPTGSFETRVTLMLEDKEGKPEKVEGTAQELFKRWIQLERNSHHVLNTMPAGSGSKGGGGNMGGRLSTEAIMAMNPAARIQLSREQGKKRQ